MSDEFVNFEVIKNNWQEYELSNGTRISVRHSLREMSFKDEKVLLNWSVSFHTIPVQEDKGTPTEGSMTLKEEDIIEEMKFKQIKESVDVIDVPDKKIIIISKGGAVRIQKTNRFDSNGTRVYLVDGGSAFSTVKYPEVKKTVPSGSQTYKFEGAKALKKPLSKRTDSK